MKKYILSTQYYPFYHTISISYYENKLLAYKYNNISFDSLNYACYIMYVQEKIKIRKNMRTVHRQRLN